MLTTDDILKDSGYITSTQAAKLSGLSLSGITRALERNALPSVKIGTWRLIERAAFEAWLDGRERRKRVRR